jgi:hypothetical protein
MVIPFWRMKIALAIAGLCLAVNASGQEPRQPSNGVLVGSNDQPAGVIRGVVIEADGQPAKGMRVIAIMQCPSACGLWMEDATTNRGGEYRFQHVPVGKYSIFANNPRAGYPLLRTPAGVVELTSDHPGADLHIDLPPKTGILMVHLTDRTTGTIIPRALVKVAVADDPNSIWSEGWADSSECVFYPDCAIPVPPDKQLLVHVSSAGFHEWDESAGKGKAFLVHSGTRLSWDIQLQPLTH